MRRSVIRHGREASVPVHDRLHTVALREGCALKIWALEGDDLVVAEAVGAEEPGTHARLLVLDEALIRHLAAALRVERRLEQLRLEGAVLARRMGRESRQHLGLLVADELALRPADVADGARLPGAGDLAMLGHPPREVLLVHAEAALARELVRQLDREPVRGCQREGVLAGDLALRRDLLEELHPARERLGEPLLLGPHGLPDPL